MFGLAGVAAVVLLTIVEANVIVYSISNRQIADEFRDLPANFGGEIPFEGMRGYLVEGEPADGCAPLAKPPAVTDNITDKWMVLLARYNCSFEDKIRNAQNAGFDCAIVHNVNSSDLEPMSAKDPDGIVIPSVFVSDLAGIILKNEYLYTNGYYIMVNSDIPFNINTHLLLPFAIVVALCLLVMLIFLIVKWIKDRRRANRNRLPRRSLRKIPTCKFSKGDPYDTCAICLDDYVEGDKLRVLPCAHAYHSACIDPWLTKSRRVCPVCKRRVLLSGEVRAGDSDSDAPLVSDRHDTQGGTFEPQTENPFVRAARFMSRLRRSRPTDNAEAPPPTEGNDEDVPEQEEVDEQAVDERRSLLRSSRVRRGRRRAAAGSVPEPTFHPTPSPPPLRPAEHSINRERGEIGVAAIPADLQRHVSL